MTSPHYRGEGGENTRHRVTGGVSVPVATGRGEGRRFFSRHTDSTGLSNSCGLCGLVHQGNRGMLGIRRRTTEKPRAPGGDATVPYKRRHQNKHKIGASTGSQVSESSKFRNYSTHRRNPETNSAVKKEDPQGNAQGP